MKQRKNRDCWGAAGLMVLAVVAALPGCSSLRDQPVTGDGGGPADGGDGGARDGILVDADGPDGAAGLRPRGAACDSPAVCASGFCSTDGVCCDRACTDPCEACNVAGSTGTCALVASGQPRGKPACPGSGPCQGACTGASAACTFPGGTTACGANTCASTTLTPAGACNGAGACQPGPTVECAPYLCAVDRCLTSCEKNEDCATNHFCDTSSKTCVSRAVEIGVGSAHTCALLADGTVWCWGANGEKQLGVDVGTTANKPVELPGLKGRLKAFGGGGSGYTCAITTDNKVLCWGTSVLGTDTLTTSRFDAKPVQTVSRVDLDNVRALATAYEFACALRDDGVWCWGAGGAGELGTGNTDSSAVAVRTLAQTNITRIDVGIGAGSAIRRSTGEIFVWGLSFLGDGLGGSTPVTIQDAGVERLGIGDRIWCLLTPASAMRCYASGPNPGYRNWPQALGNVSLMAVGTSTVCAAQDGGAVSCGRPGAAFVEQSGIRNPVRLASESYASHFCAIAQDGRVICWGNNSSGQLGIGSSGGGPDKPPTQVTWK